jgi:hypothetical protein
MRAALNIRPVFQAVALLNMVKRNVDFITSTNDCSGVDAHISAVRCDHDAGLLDWFWQRQEV